MQKIFAELKITNPEVARELAIYWDHVTKRTEDVAVINNEGHLIGRKFYWHRPLSRSNATVLLNSLREEGNNETVKTDEEGAEVKFSTLHYNIAWVKEIVRQGHLAAAETSDGLQLYESASNGNGKYFREVYWPLRGVKITDLGEVTEVGVKICPLSDEHEEVEYAKLCFGVEAAEFYFGRK